MPATHAATYRDAHSVSKPRLLSLLVPGLSEQPGFPSFAVLIVASRLALVVHLLCRPPHGRPRDDRPRTAPTTAAVALLRIHVPRTLSTQCLRDCRPSFSASLGRQASYVRPCLARAAYFGPLVHLWCVEIRARSSRASVLFQRIDNVSIGGLPYFDRHPLARGQAVFGKAEIPKQGCQEHRACSLGRSFGLQFLRATTEPFTDGAQFFQPSRTTSRACTASACRTRSPT